MGRNGEVLLVVPRFLLFNSHRFVPDFVNSTPVVDPIACHAQLRLTIVLFVYQYVLDRTTRFYVNSNQYIVFCTQD